MARADYDLYKKFLLELHKMHRFGTDQTDEADIVRDQMDGPGFRMTEEEAARMSGMSADLFMLSGDEVKLKADLPIDMHEFERVANSENWNLLLEMLRTKDFPASDDEIASTRAACWAALGDFDVALLFAEHAAKLKPGNKNYRVMVTLTRLNAGLGADSAAIAEMCNLLGPQVIHNSIHEMSFLQTA